MPPTPSSTSPTLARQERVSVSRSAPLGEVLVSMGLLTAPELQGVLARQKADGRRLGDLLVADGRLSRDQVSRAIAQRMGVDFQSLADGVDPSVAHLIDDRSARRYSAVPVGLDPDGTLVVAMADPLNVLAIDDLRMVTRREIRPVLALPEDIASVLRETREVDEVVEDLAEEARADDGVRGMDLDNGVDQAPVVRFVNSVISRAVEEGASDIHFEPQARQMIVRYRVDGVLRQATAVPSRISGGVVSRIKIMADLDIAERRMPQDGRIGLTVAGRSTDLRVACLPTVHGEKVVIRVLDKSNVPLQLGELGFTPDVLERFERCYQRPYGAVLVTGPTGSGKSTTLYGTLNQINTAARNIITVEDPVEYRMVGVNQMQVNPKAGLTFAAGLRSILRCDPDVIMIGEIRDRETAQIAVESALTGHLVLATLHTNDAAGALTRLTEMGVEAFLSSSAVVGSARPAARAAPVQRLPPGGLDLPGGPAPRGARREPSPRPARPGAHLHPGGLQPLPRNRLPRPPGRLRDARHERAPQAAGGRRRVGGRARQAGPRRGDEDPGRGRPGQGARRPHVARGAGAHRRLGPRASCRYHS